ncbi:MAG: hypothetical protein HRU40_04985 [Saprospiraceae bacterium]|nr:hypothetical protein [Saprospiraceae bacterium]
MQLTAEISMYPLQTDYEPLILSFIAELRKNPDIITVTNAMSTQIKGPYQTVWSVLQKAIYDSVAHYGKSVFVVKFIADDLPILEGPNLKINV